MKYFILVLTILLLIVFACGQESETGELSDSQPFELVEIYNDNLPAVYFNFVIKAGSADDPEGKEGLAWFTANYLKRGTGELSRDQIEDSLRILGSRINIRVDREIIEITGQTLTENLEEFYGIFKSILLEPSFAEDEAVKLRDDQQQAIKNIIRNDARLCEAVLHSELYRGNSYAHPVQGYISCIDKLTTTDAREFYKTYFTIDNILCGIAGKFPEDFSSRIKEDLSKLPENKDIIRDANPVKKYADRQVVLVEKEGRDQSQIRIGRVVDYLRTDSVWYPLLAANTYLGQHRESLGRLYTTIRSERGLSYGAYSYHEHFEQAGWSKNPRPLIPFKPQYFSIWTYPKVINTEFAVKMAIYEYEKLLRDYIDAEMLETVKSFQINHFPFLIETPAQRLAMTLEENYYQLTGYIENFSEQIKAVTVNDVNDAVKTYWASDDLLIVIVTDDAEAMKDELLDIETELELPSGASSEGLEDINRMVINTDLNLKPENIKILHAEELFN